MDAVVTVMRHQLVRILIAGTSRSSWHTSFRPATWCARAGLVGHGNSRFVMPGLDPGIPLRRHYTASLIGMAGTSPAMTIIVAKHPILPAISLHRAVY